MPHKNLVPDLVSLSLKNVGHLVRSECERVSWVCISKFYLDEFEATEEEKAKVAMDREIYLSDQVEFFKTFFFSYIPGNLLERTLEQILRNIERAVNVKKLQWTPSTNMKRFTHELYAIVKFSNLLVLPHRQSLDLGDVPKMIRSKLYGKLPEFKGLKRLALGSGSGGWVTEAYSESFILGIPHMQHLVSFSLQYDCTSSILQVLAEHCHQTLKVLDIERSRQVRGDSIPYFLALENLVELNIFQADLTTSEQVEVLTNLKALTHLKRGDFLCEVVEYMEEMNMPNRLKVEEFWASEEYFFHSDEQMELTAKYCPNIKKMLFMFQDTQATMSTLKLFKNLQDLELWGGAFYTDEISDLLENLGPNLSRLSLVHTEEMDEKAFALITVWCSNLQSLGFHNCDFVEMTSGDDEDFIARFRMSEMRKEISKMTSPLWDVRVIKIVSSCPKSFLTLILQNCINVEEIFMGMNTAIDDETVLQILARNELQHLRKVTIQGCKDLTLQGVETLIQNCPQLNILQDLTGFRAIHEHEIKILQLRIKEENLNLDLGLKDDNDYDMLTDGRFMHRKLRDNLILSGRGENWTSDILI